MKTIEKTLKDKVQEAVSAVSDPEIPVLSIVDLGIVQHIDVKGTEVVVTMTPTFVGCPAIDYMKNQILEAVNALPEVTKASVIVDLESKWSTDQMTDEAREKLEKFGIAPPSKLEGEELSLEALEKVRCPHCGSADTSLNTPFGSTLCRAISYCYNCKQSFEQFKPI